MKPKVVWTIMGGCVAATETLWHTNSLLSLVSLSFLTSYWLLKYTPPYSMLISMSPLSASFTSPWRWRQHSPLKHWYPI